MLVGNLCATCAFAFGFLAILEVNRRRCHTVTNEIAHLKGIGSKLLFHIIRFLPSAFATQAVRDDVASSHSDATFHPPYGADCEQFQPGDR